ncbi:MAG: hypothetical protein WBM08_05640 [Prochlorococcaceae cyanobacterium]
MNIHESILSIRTSYSRNRQVAELLRLLNDNDSIAMEDQCAILSEICAILQDRIQALKVGPGSAPALARPAPRPDAWLYLEDKWLEGSKHKQRHAATTSEKHARFMAAPEEPIPLYRAALVQLASINDWRDLRRETE